MCQMFAFYFLSRRLAIAEEEEIQVLPNKIWHHFHGFEEP